MLEALLGGLIGSIITAIAAVSYSEMQRRRDRNGIRAQIEFLLRQLQTHMGMIRDYPRYYFYDVQPLVSRLVELSLAPLSASGLTKDERDAVFQASISSGQAAAFLTTDRDRALQHGDEEYIRAAGLGAFRDLHSAREALKDSGALTRPGDPRALHNWHVGDKIPDSDVA